MFEVIPSIWKRPYPDISIVSGYFNPIHRGHIEYMEAAKSKGDQLLVIVNTDDQVKLKGSDPFMNEQDRLFIVRSLRCVDQALLALDFDRTVAGTLKQIRAWYPNNRLTFFNSGDRNMKRSESAEVKMCEECKIFYEILDLPKVCSSSDLIKQCKLRS